MQPVRVPEALARKMDKRHSDREVAREHARLAAAGDKQLADAADAAARMAMANGEVQTPFEAAAYAEAYVHGTPHAAHWTHTQPMRPRSQPALDDDTWQVLRGSDGD